jgi:hypothetical protein
MDSTHTASLDIPELSAAAAMAHVFQAMANNSLLSVGQLCNEVYSVNFTIDHSQRTQRFGHRIVAHQLVQRYSAQHNILSK